MICDNLSINHLGHLTFAGYDTVELAKKYGTPLYLMDENKIREHMRTYKNAMAKYFPKGSCPEFASKAFSCKQIYRIAAKEEINIDVVSSGEIFTAVSAGFPMDRVFFHGNNKIDSDLAFAIDNKVGFIVIDNPEEAEALNRIANEKSVIQKVLLRVTPGIDTHTHKKINTGSVDSKFGVGIPTGQAKALTEKILTLKNLELLGFHCHIGSQLFESEPFIMASEMMITYIKDIKDTFGFETEILNLGGGFGVRYTENEPEIDYNEKLSEVAKNFYALCEKYCIKPPKVAMEPGRSIVADAGLTLYSVGAVKEIPNLKNYVSIDGGMTDNPRFTLYEAPYTVILASRANDNCDYTATITGRCCESGDIIQENVKIPKPYRNEILAVLTTGAYNYSMASHYNRLPNPPVVMLNDKGDYVAVKRETLEDICRNDI